MGAFDFCGGMGRHGILLVMILGYTKPVDSVLCVCALIGWLLKFGIVSAVLFTSRHFSGVCVRVFPHFSVYTKQLFTSVLGEEW